MNLDNKEYYMLRLALLSILVLGTFGIVLQADESEAYNWDRDQPHAEAEAAQPPPLGTALAQDLLLTNQEGDAVHLQEAVQGSATLLVIYRGGWCPFCTTQLAGLGEVRDSLLEYGVDIIGISPDGPEALKESGVTHELAYTLLGDSQGKVIRRLGLIFTLDEETVERYQEMGLPLATDEWGNTVMPVPAVLLIDETGVIRWTFHDANFRERPDVDVVLEAVVELTQDGDSE